MKIVDVHLIFNIDQVNALRVTFSRFICILFSEQHKVDVNSRCGAMRRDTEGTRGHKKAVFSVRTARVKPGITDARNAKGCTFERRMNELRAFAPGAVRHGSQLAKNWRTARQRKLTRPPLFNRRDRPNHCFESRYRHYPCPCFTRAVATTISLPSADLSKHASLFTPGFIPGPDRHCQGLVQHARHLSNVLFTCAFLRVLFLRAISLRADKSIRRTK